MGATHTLGPRCMHRTTDNAVSEYQCTCSTVFDLFTVALQTNEKQATPTTGDGSGKCDCVK